MLKKLLQVIGSGVVFTLLLGAPNLCAQQQAPAQTVTEFRNLNGMNYLSASRFADIFKVKTYFNAQSQKMILYLPDQRLKFSAYSSYIMINSEIYHLPTEVLPSKDDLLIPVASFVDIIQPHLGFTMRYEASVPELQVNYEPVNITNLIVEEKKNGTLIRFPVTRTFRETEYKAWQGNAGWFYLTVAGGYINEQELAGAAPGGVIRKIVPIQMDGSVQFSFRLREKIKDYEIYQNSNPREIVISLRKPSFNGSVELNEARNRWKLDRIVLDAGHGGKDPGAIGHGGMYEKHVVLDVTKRVGKLIEKNLPDVEVIYTRKTDKFIPLRERAKIANEKNGKLFVSVHANSNGNKNVRGFETYLLRPGKTQDAIDVAERENAVIRFEESTEIYEQYENEQLILATMAQSAFMKESEDFASLVQQGLNQIVPSKNRGVKQAGFYVLVGASMPNILVEIGFLTNPREGKNLGWSEYRQKIANGIYEGIRDFKTKYDQQITEQASL
ncbi:MAG: N-acetylmuramoyl-L-alanine amidase [Candidatus Marinimicrobia bacterium]|nr:N-acetylmuramoyl-L-alanine amidase [Candidatus Neomarinimicrobiota bacterium]MCF7828850.1 N-acetylmuramoyl-L-alanine amidase [Candidatus Neomarinimicrobiota bacterium]MCF7880767.1 N-acetylmuramoyl-L-alanine amidase [Candidatus Neomarinimicrobiota bacterium]